MKIWILLLMLLSIQGQCSWLQQGEEMNFSLVNVYADQAEECQEAPLATSEISFDDFVSIFISADLKPDFNLDHKAIIYPCTDKVERKIEILAKSLTENQRRKVSGNFRVVGMLFFQLVNGQQEMDIRYREVNGEKKIVYRKFVLRPSVQSQMLQEAKNTKQSENFEPAEWERIRLKDIRGLGENAYSSFKDNFSLSIKYMLYWARQMTLSSDLVSQDNDAYRTLVKVTPKLNAYPFGFNFSTKIGNILYHNQLTYMERVVLNQGKVVTPCPISLGDDSLFRVIPKEEAKKLYSAVTAALMAHPNLLLSNECVYNLFSGPLFTAPDTSERRALYKFLKTIKQPELN
jgi:hypothetical protein